MSEKTVLVTGCSSGIGRCAIEILRDRGYTVFATARSEEDVEILQKLGFQSFLLDLTSESSIENALKKVLSLSGGKLYALFNNAGFGVRGAVEDITTNSLREQFETNFFGMHSLTRRVIPIMRSQGYGRIIQNSSLMGIVALKFRGAYSASKYAMEGLSDALRQELAGSNVFVSLIQTGPVLATGFRENSMQSIQSMVEIEDSVHNNNYEKILIQQSSSKPMNFSVPPEAVVRQVLDALENPRPKIRYRVGFPNRLFAGLKRILPDFMLDYLLINWSHTFFAGRQN